MKVYRFELRRQLRNTISWTVVILGVLWLLLYGYYPIFLDSRVAVEELFAGFPKGFATAFGFDLDNLFSYESFSGMVYLYEGILVAIMASGTAIAVFSREKRSKCMDFILTKPLHRSEIFFHKLLICLTLVMFLNLLYLILFAFNYLKYSGSTGISHKMILSLLCLPFTSLVFVSFGVFAGVFLRRVRSPSGVATGIAMFAFLLSMVYSLTEKEFFRLISPLYYFSPNAVVETGGYDPACVVVAIILSLGLTIAAYLKYTRADVPVL